MICYILIAVLAQIAGTIIPTSAEGMVVLGIWTLCDIELLKLLFKKG